MNKKYVEWIIEAIFLAIIIVITFQPFFTSDFYFHLKTGEDIVQNGRIPFTDEYSSSVLGKPIIPYEWLFEVWVYIAHDNFGLTGVAVLASFFLAAYLLLFRQILVEIFELSLPFRIFFMSLIIFLNYAYWSERPQIAAFTFFLATTYLVLKRVYKGKNLLYITPPIFWIWTNLHASMIVGLGLFFSYFAFFSLRLLLSKDKKSAEDKKRMKDLGLYSVINLVVTVLPPLGFKVYELLWKFYKNRELISSFLDEWAPLDFNAIHTKIYLVLYGLAVVTFMYVMWKLKSKREQLLLMLPLVPIALLMLTGERHAPFSFPLLLIFLIPIIRNLSLKIPKYVTHIAAVCLVLILGYGMQSFVSSTYAQYEKDERYYPEKAIPFMKENLKGNMLSDIKQGGYFMNALGPTQKVVIDGRTEMYLPEQLTDFQNLSNHKYDPEDQFYSYFDDFTKKYEVSWVFILSQNFTVWRKVMHILYSKPDWHLVYFDDSGIIMVRDDGKNTEVIKNYEMKSITPFQKDLFKDGQEEEAFAEYKKMDTLMPSSVSKNSIGYFLFKQKKFDEAKTYFEQSIKLDKYAATPKINLAEIVSGQGDLNGAIKLYEEVLEDDPTRTSAYLRLGQLYIKTGQPKQKAIELWQKGLQTEFLDDAMKQRFIQEINGV